MEKLLSSHRNSHMENPPLCPKKYQVPGLNLVSANGYTFLQLPPCASGNGRVKIFIQNSLSKSRTVNTVARVTSKLVRGTPPDVKCWIKCFIHSGKPVIFPVLCPAGNRHLPVSGLSSPMNRASCQGCHYRTEGQ